jgi:transcriptional regulator with PAS, ATPase and Fis domain
MVLETFKQDLPTGYAWPGNVRELEQGVRRILLTRHYAGDMVDDSLNQEEALLRKIRDGNLTVAQLTADYCSLLYRQFGTYGAVAQRTQLDSRTVKKYLQKNYDQNIS